MEVKEIKAQFTELELDMNFGRWLSRRRCQAGLTLEDVFSRTEIKISRLRSLELATFLKGITLKEARILAHLYKVPVNSFITHIVG